MSLSAGGACARETGGSRNTWFDWLDFDKGSFKSSQSNQPFQTLVQQRHFKMVHLIGCSFCENPANQIICPQRHLFLVHSLRWPREDIRLLGRGKKPLYEVVFSPLSHQNNSNCTISLAPKIEDMCCVGCAYLNLSDSRKQHIVERHFLNENLHFVPYKDSDSIFSPNVFPDDLFNTVQLHPRYQLEQRGWSSEWVGNRFIYSLSFNFYVGIYPLLGLRTKVVDIICDCTLCPVCGVHPPTEIVTIYPAHAAVTGTAYYRCLR